MSGGEWNYAYRQFAEVGDRLQSEELGILVGKLSEVLRIIEWVDSEDMLAPADELAIKDFLQVYGDKS